MQSRESQLAQPEDDFESPAWHDQMLKETERRLAEGKEQVLDWETAKRQLRKQFE